MTTLAPTDDCPRFLAINMAGGDILDEASAVKLAQTTALVSAQPGQIQAHLAAMKAANPAGRWLAYLNSSFGRDGQPDGWYGRDASGTKLTSKQYTQNYVMLPYDPDWVANRVSAAQIMFAAGFHGVMLDMCGPAPTNKGYLTGQLVDPRTGKPYTAAAWIADTAALAKAVKAALGDTSVVVGNGLQSGGSLVDTTAPTLDLLVPGGMDGGLAESWMHDLAWDAQTYQAALNLPATVAGRAAAGACMVKPWGQTDPKVLDQIHRFTLATFHLGKAGAAYYGYTASAAPADIVCDSPYEHVALGPPWAAAAVANDGHYHRAFKTGLVLANPTAVALTVPLALHRHWWGGFHTLKYTNLDGQQVTSVTLPPMSGEILTVA